MKLNKQDWRTWTNGARSNYASAVMKQKEMRLVAMRRWDNPSADEVSKMQDELKKLTDEAQRPCAKLTL